jgi:uronate dehydrogenase
MTSSSTTAPRFHRLLLTGAAGGLGTILRERLRHCAEILRLSDIAELQAADGAAEELRTCNLADKQAVFELVEGVDAILHFGGVSVERPFEEVLDANIRGVFHIYEAARRHGVKRVIFASSNHVIGFYPQSETIDADVPHRPDSYYGLSKAYGEDMASFYHDRYGIETVSLRIGSSFAEPRDRRMLSTWLSYDDLVQLIEKSLFTPNVGHTIVYGVSGNPQVWWDNRKAAQLGYQPRSSSEPFKAQVERQPAPASSDPAVLYQGGSFAASGPFGDPA